MQETPFGQPARHRLRTLGLIALPLGVGAISSLMTSDAMAQFGRLNQPPLSPPAWLFPVAWTILYVLMGAASARLVGYEPADEGERTMRKVALVLYGLQLAVNFAWSLVFFGLGAYWVAFAMLVVMWLHIAVLTALAFRLDRVAGLMLFPYLAWSTFAGYLNVAIALMN